MRPLPAIAFYLPQTGIFREIVLGIYDYADRHQCFRVHSLFREWNQWERVWEVPLAGLIFNQNQAGHVPLELRRPLPAVNVSGVVESAIPTVVADNEAIGRLAAEHLLSCGFANFATVGRPVLNLSHRRRTGFVQALQRHGAPAQVFDDEVYHRSIEEICRSYGPAEPSPERLERWLEGLARPVGVFTHDDTLGRHISRICAARGWKVPGEVGILGCDNDPMFCGECFPQLSSVIYPGYAVGWQAAALLDNLLRDPSTPPPLRHPVTPSGIQLRGSTDLPAARHPLLHKAVRHLRQNLAEDLSVGRLAEVAGMSRRSFERRFREAFWMSPLDLIRRERVRKVRLLLLQRDLPMSHIAELSGFQSAQRMATVFKEETGLTPSEFRRHHHPDDPGGRAGA